RWSEPAGTGEARHGGAAEADLAEQRLGVDAHLAGLLATPEGQVVKTVWSPRSSDPPEAPPSMLASPNWASASIPPPRNPQPSEDAPSNQASSWTYRGSHEAWP